MTEDSLKRVQIRSGYFASTIKHTVGKIDYRAVLSAEHFNVFSKLRELRKQIAQEEAVPVYTIFTNEQLADFVRKSVSTKTQFEQVLGVGDARVQKYCDRFLAALRPTT